MDEPGPYAGPCPRCGIAVIQEFYGPCWACRVQLRGLRPPDPEPGYQLGWKG